MKYFFLFISLLFSASLIQAKKSENKLRNLGLYVDGVDENISFYSLDSISRKENSIVFLANDQKHKCSLNLNDFVLITHRDEISRFIQNGGAEDLKGMDSSSLEQLSERHIAVASSLSRKNFLTKLYREPQGMDRNEFLRKLTVGLDTKKEMFFLIEIFDLKDLQAFLEESAEAWAESFLNLNLTSTQIVCEFSEVGELGSFSMVGFVNYKNESFFTKRGFNLPIKNFSAFVDEESSAMKLLDKVVSKTKSLLN